ncbi:glutathione S-transferase family protein [Ancylobacter sp. 6x-1]|uniref:Glutathione S-transferase family protein n=1 Tax=Ancylobacter crimeensis TaxID=2579147 RepID=A0ABT0D9X8_9HYPH|nr:glutathione S-transferase family protein [Ancylobacter crimeensis]MCK0196699.1 glutathione S-transferase family protein [Ancylobacter crimeensis]
MQLRSAPPSPFGRKVKIAAVLCGVHLDVVPADTTDPSEVLRQQNPLGKIPVLLRDTGPAVYDSPVIVEYLDMLAGGGCVLPASGERRIEVLTLQALADGLMDAALLQVYEARFRPEGARSESWLDNQAGKVARALKVLEAAPPGNGGIGGGVSGAADAGEISVACALGYLDLRFAGAWRADHPALVAWLDAFAARVPAFEATRAP